MCLKAILDGLLLGDGSIEQSYDANPRLSVVQAKSNHLWLYDVKKNLDLLELPVSIYKNRDEKECTIKGKTCLRQESYVLRSKNISILRKERLRWYPNNVKKVPLDVNLDPISIAYWLYGDGTIAGSGYRIYFCTDGFLRQDNEYLVYLLMKNYKIHATVDSRNRILIDRFDDRVKIKNIINPYFTESMARKHNIKTERVKLKLTIEMVENIREKKANGYKAEEIMDLFGIGKTTVYAALKRL